MAKRHFLRDLAIRGVTRAEASLDRLRYDLLGKGQGAEPHLHVYRGLRNEDRMVLEGRVTEDWKPQVPVSDSTLPRMRNMLRLYESDEIPGVAVDVTYQGREHRLVTDDEGYFRLEVEGLSRPLPETTKFEDVEVRAKDFAMPPVSGEILVPGRETRLGIISDIDDTIIETGATNFLKNWRRILVETPQERLAVPGAAELYRMLTGLDGSMVNPVFYVSSSPWNLYSYLEAFLRHNHMPRGPMFLRDYGIDDLKFIASPHTEHKIAAVETVLGFYPDMRFLLIGDSGQKDIEVYAHAAKAFPERIAGVFIRDVHGTGPSDLHKPALDTLRSKGLGVYFGETMEGAADLARELGFAD